MKRRSTAEFIKTANKKHGSTYNYSKTEYVNCRTKISIICKVHGLFTQTPHHHLQGQGCPQCSRNTTKNTDIFVTEARKIYGNLYDYSNTVYLGSKKKVIIYCKQHGPFLQKPNNHLSGNGCPICKGCQLKTTEVFIQAAQKVHGDVYNYSKVNYVGNKKKMIIVCKTHGPFMQNANSHLRGHGCPICAESKGEKTIAAILDKIQIQYIREYTFKDLLGTHAALRFDFAIFKNDELSCLIEYDGEQHFKHLDHFILLEKFRTLQKHDKQKDKYCAKNNIRLLRIPYTCKNIESHIISQFNQ